MEVITRIIHATEALWYYPVSASRAHLTTQPIPLQFNVLFRQYATLSLLRHPIVIIRSTGILTRLPSTTQAIARFALGPD